MLPGMNDGTAQLALDRQRSMERSEFYEVWPGTGDEQNVKTHRVATTIIATVLAKICARVPNSATVSVCGAFGSFAGTDTSDPGPGFGLVPNSSDRRRVFTSPFANRTLTSPFSALCVNPPAALK